MKATKARQNKGQGIAQLQGSVSRIDEHTYKVKSQSDNAKEYEIISSELGWQCSCPDFLYRHVKCKHVFAVEFSLELRKKVEVTKIEPITNTANCIFCHSTRIVKFGFRHNEYGDIQKYRCNDCKHYFTINIGFEKMHATPQAITSGMQLYFTGESFRNVQKFLKLQGVYVSHMSVYKWINKYVALMDKYLEQIKPNVSGVWEI